MSRAINPDRDPVFRQPMEEAGRDDLAAHLGQPVGPPLPDLA